jgi:MFS family permease
VSVSRLCLSPGTGQFVRLRSGTGAALLLLAGALSDRFGRRRRRLAGTVLAGTVLAGTVLAGTVLADTVTATQEES